MKKNKSDSKNQKPAEKTTGLYQFCPHPECRRWINGKNGYTCNHSNWYFRIVVRNKSGKTCTKILKTKNRDEAIKELIAFKKTVESSLVTSTKKNPSKK